MAWLLDTNILSEIRKPKPVPKVLGFIAGLQLEQLYISAVTLAELRFGIEMLGEGTAAVTNLTDGCRRQSGRCSISGFCPLPKTSAIRTISPKQAQPFSIRGG